MISNCRDIDLDGIRFLGFVDDENWQLSITVVAPRVP